jgi:arylsulfatase A-like enzyme
MSTDMIDDIPSYWPDDEVTRNDMLDYSYEISHFDSHLGQMIRALEETGELSNTIIIVTADNGMPFPRRKGFGYEHSTHLPLAVMWPGGIVSPGRSDSSLLSMTDIAPTLLALAGIDPEAAGMTPEGKDFLDILADSPRKDRDHLLFGQERHDYGRPGNQGYPIRSILSGGFLYMHNFKPWLWPSCDPETGYLNTDGSPVKTSILQMRREGTDTLLWHHSFGKRPQEELYDLERDPECMDNLAADPAYADIRERLKEKLFAWLKRQNDPRMGSDGDIFDRYPFNKKDNQDFYERFMAGEVTEYQTGWVNPSDYEELNWQEKSY